MRPYPRLSGLVLAIALGAGACAEVLGVDFDAYSVACTTDGDCDDANPCTTESCQGGRCSRAAVADGDRPDTAPGDCSRPTCEGGALVERDDPSDVEDDGLPCTLDLCEGGEPIHAARTGEPCTAGSAAGTCDAKGACVVECGTGFPPCDDGEPCTVDSCDEGTGSCLFMPLDAVPCPGVPDAPGDCRIPTCVSGVCGSEGGGLPDDSDVPDDGNDCTVDACDDGAPSHTALPVGMPCSTNGGKVCDAEGACVACVTAADCADVPGLPEDDACKQRACEAGVCTVKLAPDGTPVPDPAPGDCHSPTCLEGEIVVSADDSDVPVDDNPCTKDLCTAGAPSNPPENIFTLCGDGLTCDGKGACFGCIVADQCPGVDDFCKKRTCVDSFCGFSKTKVGTALPQQQQVPGDCLELQCNGEGGVVAIAKKSDEPPDDGNPCTASTCDAGGPAHLPKAAGTPCTTGSENVCDGAGSCIECLDAEEHCPEPPACKKATCVSGVCGTEHLPAGEPAPEQAGDCQTHLCDGAGNVTSVADDTDLPVDGNPCTADVCSNGVPSNPPLPAGEPCGENKTCNGLGACVTKAMPCITGFQCASGMCWDGFCCDQFCGATCMACDVPGFEGTCKLLPAGAQDANGINKCTGELACNGAGICKKALGQNCNQDSDCATSHCVHGTCCDGACIGTCMACSSQATGKPSGQCYPVLAGQDPYNECLGPKDCNGAGACE